MRRIPGLSGRPYGLLVLALVVVLTVPVARPAVAAPEGQMT